MSGQTPGNPQNNVKSPGKITEISWLGGAGSVVGGGGLPTEDFTIEKQFMTAGFWMKIFGY